MEIKCKCGSTNVFLEEKGSQKGIYCSECGKWIKWATKDEARLINHKVTTASGTIPDNYIYIKKSEYEQRLKADMVAMLSEIQLEVQELNGCSCECSDGIVDSVDDIIQQKINVLRGE